MLRYRLGCVLVLLFLVGAPKTIAVQPLPSYSATSVMRDDSTLRAIAMLDDVVGVAVGDRGTILRTENGGRTWQHRESGVDCILRDVFWLSDRRVVAAGGGFDVVTQCSRGVVVVSDDAGQHWRRADDSALAQVHRLVIDADNSLLIAVGDWSPASMSAHHVSRDGGMSWSVDEDSADILGQIVEPEVAEIQHWMTTTGSTAPIRNACRSGDANFWAVGDQGVIYQSSDGGRSWTAQRGEDRQAAVLVVADSATTVPWPIIGNEALESGNRVALLVVDEKCLQRHDPTRPREIDLVRQASVMLGAAGVDVVKQDDIAAWMNVYRADVLVLDRSLSVELREQLSQAAISGGTQRVVVASVDAIGGETRLHRGGMLTRSGVLAGDMWQDALDLVAPYVEAAESLSLKRTYDAFGTSLRGESVTAGLTLASGRTLAGERPAASRRQLQIIQARLRQPQRIEQAIQASTTRESLVATVDAIIQQSSVDDRFRLTWSMYRQAVATGNTPLQLVLLQSLSSSEHFSSVVQGSASLWAQLRLDTMRSSSEWRLLEQNKTLKGSLSRAKLNDGPNGHSSPAEVVSLSPFQNDSSRVVTAAAISPLIVPDTTPKVTTAIASSDLRGILSPHAENARSGRKSEIDLSWEFHPLVLIARDAIRRHSEADELHRVEEAGGNLQRLSLSTFSQSWSRLVAPATLVAKRATRPPRLDGVFDDDCWGALVDSTTRPVAMRLAYDDQFLYLAAEASSASFATPVAADTVPRLVRDNDLTHRDRLTISLDVDRDLMTAFRLQTTVDRLTRDAVDSQTQWQPTWYVAVAEQASTTSFEIAVRLTDLVESLPSSGEAWLCEVNYLAAGTATQETPMVEPSGWFKFSFQ